MKLNLIIGAMLAAVMTMTTTPYAVAGPDPTTAHYFPVKTVAEAETIKPGTRIAMRCGKCGAITTMIADKGKSYLHGFTCDRCKKTFVVRQDPHGGSRGEYICEDDSGDRAQLLRIQ